MIGALLGANPLAWKVGAVGLIAVGVALGVQQLRITWLKAEVAQAEAKVVKVEGEKAQLQADKRILVEANRGCESLVSAQNSAVETLKAEAAAREEAAKRAVAAAEAKAATSAARAVELSRRPMPIPNNACASLETLLNEAIQERK